MSLVIQLDRFEGPLGLLLHLIRKEEMDIFDINIHQITRQYMDYIRSMKRLDLEMAGEFIAMAATLIQIKSRMLLPQYNEDGEIVENEDPRKELVQKLIEYQKYQEVSKRLYERHLVGRDVYLRGSRFQFESSPEDGEIILEDKPLFSLISSYRTVIKLMKKGVHRVSSELQSIASRILEMKDRLIVGQRVVMSEFITATEKKSNQVLVTFLSLLELAKMGFVSIFQNETYGEIYIDPKRVVDRDVIARVEEFNAQDIEGLANQIMSTASAMIQTTEGSFAEANEPAPEEFMIATDDEIEAEEQRLLASENSLEPEMPV